VKVKSIVSSLLVLGLVSGGAFAASTGTMTQQMNQLQAKINQMQNQMDNMSSHTMSARSSGGSFVKVNSAVTKDVLAPAGTPGTVNKVLAARQSNAIASNSVYVGGSLSVVAAYEHASQAPNATTYLSTIGTGNSQNQSYVWANSIGLDTVATGDWVTGVVALGEQGYNNRSAGNNSTAQGFGVHNAYAVIGDLNKSAFYGFIGRMPVMFGNLSSMNTYTLPFTTLLFQGTADQVGMGYSAHNLTVNMAAFDSNPGNTGVGLDYVNAGYVAVNGNQVTPGHTAKNQIANFTLNLNYALSMAGMDWNFGAGYLNGSPWVTPAATPVNSNPNAAWDLNASMSWANWHALVEYIQTASQIATNPVSNTAQKLKTWNIQLANDFNMMGKASQASIGFSQLKIGSGTAETSNQFTVGMNTQWFNHVWLGAEYNYQSVAVSAANAPIAGQAVANVTNAKDNVFLLTGRTYF